MTLTQDRPPSLKRRLARVWRELTHDGQRATGGSDELSRGFFQVGKGVPALEVSAELQPATPVSSKSVIAQVRFYDDAGQPLDAASPQLRYSEKVGRYFYPYDYVHGDAFRFVLAAPPGATKVEIVLRHWRKLDTTPYSAGAVSIHPVDPIAAPSGTGGAQGGGDAWSTERALRTAIMAYASALTSASGPLSAHETPFGEAVVEHFIFETKSADLARGLALRRLDAGRDRDALSLLPFVSDRRLAEAASRRALLRWADSIPVSESPTRLGKDGAVVLIAQDATVHIANTALSALVAQGWPLEVFAAKPFDPSAPGEITWNAVETPDASDSTQVARLADQVVRAGRGRDLRMVWATSAKDALVAAAVGRRLALPVVYEVSDIAGWTNRLSDAAWRSTDEGQREEAILRVALKAADRLLVHDEADRAWLSAFLNDPSRIFAAGSEVAMAASLKAPAKGKRAE